MKNWSWNDFWKYAGILAVGTVMLLAVIFIIALAFIDSDFDPGDGTPATDPPASESGAGDETGPAESGTEPSDGDSGADSDPCATAEPAPRTPAPTASTDFDATGLTDTWEFALDHPEQPMTLEIEIDDDGTVSSRDDRSLTGRATLDGTTLIIRGTMEAPDGTQGAAFRMALSHSGDVLSGTFSVEQEGAGPLGWLDYVAQGVRG